MQNRRDRTPPIHLPRVLSKWGFCSRKAAEQLVFDGRVTVNGVVRRDVLYGIVPDRDVIAVDGRPVEKAARLYLKMNKPVGVLTTLKDPEGRKTIADLLPPHFKSAMPVGRLDRDSSGLLLLTNDHDFGNLIAGDDSRVRKVYRVVVEGEIEDARLAPLRKGPMLDHAPLKPMTVKIIEARPERTELEITLVEGKNRQIRRTLEQLGITVTALERVAIGGLTLGRLEPGIVKTLSSEEIERMSRITTFTGPKGSAPRRGNRPARATRDRSPPE